MKTMRKTGLLTILLMLSISFVGCSTNAKKTDGGSSDSLVDDAAKDLPIELNGSSDQSSAGPLQTVYFDFDSSNLTPAARTVLEENANWLKTSDKVDIQIEGHCDERGGHQYNLALGERRAKSVKDYLTALGINENRISIISYGKEKPMSFGHDDGAWSKNRRANFVITAK